MFTSSHHAWPSPVTCERCSLHVIVLVLIACPALSSIMARNCLAQTAQDRPPNIVIILVDDLGYGDLSSYGARDLRSPHIDKLVASGMRFDLFYANCPVCSPTRASILTGRYPELVGVPGVIRTHPENSWGYLAEDAVLLPAALRQAGYDTAIVGKWHLGLETPNLPNERGFQWFRGFLGDMMDDYYSHRRHGINYMRADTMEIDPQGHATDLFTTWACQYLRQAAGGKRPFYLYLAYNAPHDPIQPPVEWLQKVRQREPELSDKRAKLVALIEHLDDGIGQLMTTLEQTGLADNTLVFFTSDNGGSLPAAPTTGRCEMANRACTKGACGCQPALCGRAESLRIRARGYVDDDGHPGDHLQHRWFTAAPSCRRCIVPPHAARSATRAACATTCSFIAGRVERRIRA